MKKISKCGTMIGVKTQNLRIRMSIWSTAYGQILFVRLHFLFNFYLFLVVELLQDDASGV